MSSQLVMDSKLTAAFGDATGPTLPVLTLRTKEKNGFEKKFTDRR